MTVITQSWNTSRDFFRPSQMLHFVIIDQFWAVTLISVKIVVKAESRAIVLSYQDILTMMIARNQSMTTKWRYARKKELYIVNKL